MSATPIRIGCTGHQGLKGAVRDEVDDAIRAALPNIPFVGMCSLAEGADQMFAQAVLEAGGGLDVVIPCDNYDTTFQTPEDRNNYLRLLDLATRTEHLDYPEPTEEAFFAAGKYIAASCDMMIAVWDGKPSRGLGGTADVVDFARSVQRGVQIIWPEGATR